MSADPVVFEYDSGHRTRLSKVLETLNLIAASGARGMTSRDLGAALYPADTSGKSRAGSPLTRLHKEGRLVALAEQRDGHHVYVLPEHVNDRETWPGYRHRGHCASCSCDST